MPKEFINPPTLSQPAGYTHIVKAGNTIYLAGQIAMNAKGEVVGAGDFQAQLRQVFANLEAALSATGATKRDLVAVTIYLVGREYVQAFRDLRSEFFGEHPPTSTLLVISGLARPELLVEIAAIAVVG